MSLGERLTVSSGSSILAVCDTHGAAVHSDLRRQTFRCGDSRGAMVLGELGERIMAYEDDDLFDDDFEFVDEDSDIDSEVDEASEQEEAAPTKPKKRPAGKKGRGKPASKKPSRSKGRSEVDDDSEDAAASDGASDEESAEGEAEDGEAAEEQKPEEPVGPPADHVVRIYEFGKLTRTLPRQFTDADAVAFAEEYSRTGKVYGRLAIPAHQDDPPAESFADAAKQ